MNNEAPAYDALKKRARQIIDAVIESPVIVEVRTFSQPEEVDRLEDRIVALLTKSLVAPAAPGGRDKALARQTMEQWLSNTKLRGWLNPVAGEWGVLTDCIASALATVRAEGEKAAFKDCITELCIDCAEGDEPTFDAQAKWYYHEAGTKMEVGCSASKLRIRVAALESARIGKGGV